MTREEILFNKHGNEILNNFLSKIDKTDECWLWKAYKNKGGYGLFCPKWRSLTVFAHRFSYFYFKDSIPLDLTVDHKCRIKHCVNPQHLRLLTRSENVMIGDSIPAKNARKDICLNGHALEFYIRIRNGIKTIARHCQVCDTLRHSEYRNKRRLLIENNNCHPNCS